MVRDRVKTEEEEGGGESGVGTAEVDVGLLESSYPVSKEECGEAGLVHAYILGFRPSICANEGVLPGISTV